MQVLLIDNYDSYTFNLFQLIAAAGGEPPAVLANDSHELAALDGVDCIVISPGPGRPGVERDLGRVADILRDTHLPVLGVCLGHQALAHVAGGDVVSAPSPRHGHLTTVTHRGDALFDGIPCSFQAVRYHSLCVKEPLPAGLRATAWAEDGVLMALRHIGLPRWGVQFHPESIASEHGHRLMANFLALAAVHRGGRLPAETGADRLAEAAEVTA